MKLIIIILISLILIGCTAEKHPHYDDCYNNCRSKLDGKKYKENISFSDKFTNLENHTYCKDYCHKRFNITK